MRLVGVLVGGAVVFGTGLLADTGKASPSIRLFSQAVAALMVVLAGLEVGLIPLLYISIPLTVFYLVGGANAFNLIDGIDGLAAGVAAVGCLFFGILSLWNGSSAGLVLSAALLGSSLGFLYFNFHPAKVFMGDGGSFLLGFVLASLAVLFTSTPYSFVWFAAPILVLGVPVFDTFLAIMRRLGGRKRLFLGDRRHFYDLVRARGWGDANTVLLMYGLAVVLGASALLVIHLELAAALVVIAVEAVALLVAALRLKALSSGM